MFSRRIPLTALALLTSTESVALKGQQVHCIKDHAHLVDFDVEGEPNDGSSMKGVERAIITVTPSPAHASHCSKVRLEGTPEGDKDFCYGANQDSSCKAARQDIPIKDGFDCKDCFVSAEADAFYKLNYTMTKLNSVALGLRNINLRASAAIHTLLAGSGTVASGSIPFPGSDKTITLIDTLVGCPVCVKVNIKVAFPTALDYSLTLTGQADLEGGAQLDINLGDNVVNYDSVSGWSHQADKAKISVTPLLVANAKATADLKMTVKTSAQVNIDNIAWYHLNMKPSLDTQLQFQGSGLFHHNRVCLHGDAAFDMEQEADLDWDLKIWHEKHHWGPSQLYTWSKSGIVSACKNIDIHTTDGTSTMLI